MEFKRENPQREVSIENHKDNLGHGFLKDGFLSYNNEKNRI